VLKPSHLREPQTSIAGVIASTFAALIILIFAPSFADSNLSQISYSYNSASAGMGIRLTILPATNDLSTATPNRFSGVETALNSNELNTLELDSKFLADFSLDSENGATETPAEMLSRLEQAIDKIQSDTTSEAVVLTISAG
jgi:hypothetical protein